MSQATLRVLLIEDSASDRALLEESLLAAGLPVEVTCADSLAQAFCAAQRATFDLVLLDLSLPDSQGLGTVKAAAEAFAALPIIVLTGWSDEKTGNEAVRAGAQDYLVKGVFSPDALGRSIRYAVERHAVHQALREARDHLEELVQERTRDLASSRQHLQRVVHSAPLVILAVDTQGRFTLADGKLDLLGLKPDQVVGRPMRDVVGDRADILGHFVRAARGEQVTAEVQFGTLFLDLGYSPLRDENGQTTGVICVCTDITERRRIEREVLEATESEQRRIGRDLHDSIQGSLVGIGFMLSAHKIQVLREGSSREALAAKIDTLSKIVNDTLVQTRGLAQGLCPVDLKGDGLAHALEQLAATTSGMFRMDCQFTCEEPVTVSDESVATQFYYIAQEAVNNSVKHAKSKRIAMRLEQREDRLSVAVEDDGIGISLDACSTGGMGLRTMHYRARLIGARLSIGPGKNGGTAVACDVVGQR